MAKAKTLVGALDGIRKQLLTASEDITTEYEVVLNARVQREATGIEEGPEEGDDIEFEWGDDEGDVETSLRLVRQELSAPPPEVVEVVERMQRQLGTADITLDSKYIYPEPEQPQIVQGAVKMDSGEQYIIYIVTRQGLGLRLALAEAGEKDFSGLMGEIVRATERADRTPPAELPAPISKNVHSVAKPPQTRAIVIDVGHARIAHHLAHVNFYQLFNGQKAEVPGVVAANLTPLAEQEIREATHIELIVNPKLQDVPRDMLGDRLEHYTAALGNWIKQKDGSYVSGELPEARDAIYMMQMISILYNAAAETDVSLQYKVSLDKFVTLRLQRERSGEDPEPDINDRLMREIIEKVVGGTIIERGAGPGGKMEDGGTDGPPSRPNRPPR